MGRRARSVGSAVRGAQGPLRVARPRADHDRTALRGASIRDGRVRPRRGLADPAGVADRRGDGARRRAHRPGYRRLPQRDLRQRAGAHHRADRSQRRADRGRPRVSVGKRDRQPPPRPRRLARRRREGRPRPVLELPLVRAHRVRDAPLPRPVGARLGRRPGHRRARAGVAGDLDRPPRRLRRGHLVLAAPSHGDARRVRRRDRRLVVPPGARRARGRHRRDGAHRRDPRRLARGVRATRSVSRSSSSPRSSSRSSGTPRSTAAPSSSLREGRSRWPPRSRSPRPRRSPCS